MREGGLPRNIASVNSQQPTPQETHSVTGEWVRGFDWLPSPHEQQSAAFPAFHAEMSLVS